MGSRLLEDRMDSKRAKVLIVEDQDHVRSALALALGGKFEALTAADPEEAVCRLRENQIDLVLQDIGLPAKRDGLDLLAKIRMAWPKLPVVILTGSSEGDVGEKCSTLGVSDFVLKPVDLAELNAKVTKALRSTTSQGIQAGLRVTAYPKEEAEFGGLLSQIDSGKLDYAKAIDWVEKTLILHTLSSTKGNMSETASILGVPRTTLIGKVNVLKIEIPS